MSINAFYSSVVTSTGAPQAIKLATNPQFIRVQNLSLFGYSGTSVIPLDVSLNVPSGVTSTVGLATSATSPGVSQIALSSGGISIGSTNPITTGSPIAITSITNASPAVVTTGAAHGLSTGDVVWVSSATGMQQIAQMPFSITVTSTTAFELTFLDASGFSAPATGGSVAQVMNFGGAVSPFTGVITSLVSSGTQTLATLSVAQNIQVGQMYQLSVPTIFGGMLSLNLNTGRFAPSNLGGYEVTAFDSSTNVVTLNVNSSQMGTFAFPSDATVLTQPAGIIQPAQMTLAGTYWGNLGNVGFSNASTVYALLGSGVCGRTGDTLLVTYGWLAN